MHMVYFLLYLFAGVCFGAAVAGRSFDFGAAGRKIDLVALGLLLWVAVEAIKAAHNL